MHHCHSSLTVTLTATFLFTIGCGGYNYGPTGKITGRLTMDGKPLAPDHAVSFMEMEKGFLAFGKTDADGKFEVSSWNQGDMPIGKYKVMIAAPPASMKPESEISAEERFDNPESIEPVTKLAFPKKYTDTTTSGLEYQIKAGANNFDIALKSE
jgi:hypothetical protein